MYTGKVMNWMEKENSHDVLNFYKILKGNCFKAIFGIIA